MACPAWIRTLSKRWRWWYRERLSTHLNWTKNRPAAPALRDKYGRDSLGEKALLARRMVEAGVTFTVVSGRWGYFDHHGDNVPPWGGIEKGLKPILPRIDVVLHTLIHDLEERGLLDSTLVLMLGEFGRSPVMTKDAGPRTLGELHVHVNCRRRLKTWSSHRQHRCARL